MMLGKTLNPNGAPAAPAAPPSKTSRRAGPATRTTRNLLVLAIVVVLVAAAAALWLLRQRSAANVAYDTAPAVRGNLTQSVTASGTVNAQDTVSVGTQVSGTIQTLYVDFNSRVRKGQVLAQLDPSQLQAQLAQARAAVAQAAAQAEASRQSEAGARFSVDAASAAAGATRSDVVRARAALSLARQTLSRDRTLLSRGYIAQSQYDADFANAIAAQTALDSANATALQYSAQTRQSGAQALGSASTAQAAQAAVESASANLAQDELNLRRTTITSPVDGTIVARNVSVGQTVAASFQTPTLFTIAQDLTKMEVDIAVGEPDIGSVRPGDTVSFTVLAYPNRPFTGVVSQVRVNPTTIANVVTYTVVILVGNKQGLLLPGMTANAAIAVAHISNALLVPVQALTYRPPRSQTGRVRRNATSPWGATAAGVPGSASPGTRGVVFVLRNNEPHAVPVRIDLVNGTQAAITPLRSLGTGEPVILSDSASTAPAARASTNPAFGMGRVVR